MRYRVVIVEDDTREADRLVGHLRRYERENEDLSLSVQVIGSAMEFLERRPAAELFFMDIAMPGINGMEAAQVLRSYDSETPLVFVTDLAQYAVKGYQVDALDFMVKPVSYGDFALRMDRVMRILECKSNESLVIHIPDGDHVVAIRDIVYIDTVRHDVRYHLANGEELRRRGSLVSLEEALSPKGFVRVSASHLVNMAHVAVVRAGSVVLTSGEKVSLGRSRRRASLEALSAYLGES